MKKVFAFLLALALLCTASTAVFAESEVPGLGDEMPDFSVTLVDGSTFILSEVLKEKQLVLINLWYSKCTPCRLEFPFMQAAWEKYRDQVSVVALSVDPSDTPDVIRDYMKDVRLALPMGQDTPSLSYQFNPIGFPTSILVDRFGKIVYIGAGSILDEGVFTSLFDQFLGDDYTETKVKDTVAEFPKNRYSVLFLDKDYHGVADCSVSFCTDTTCYPVTSNAQGAAVFDGEQQEYHIQIVDYPEEYTQLYIGSIEDDWKVGEDKDFYTSKKGGMIIILMFKDGEI